MALDEGRIENGDFVKLDYLASYIDERGFDVAKLINDDFFLAIKALFNKGLYVSASKLLLIFINAISFVAYSDSSSTNFRKWLDHYVDLTSIGLTSEELWEHRNAMLHFTGLDSRKTRDGKVRRCMAYVGKVHPMPPSPAGETWYNLNDLISAIAKGLEAFLGDFLPTNIETFVRNYDQICSDTRLLVFREDK